MNIFVLDFDPEIAAQMLCDKHVVKMCLETAQIICTVYHVQCPGIETPYKPTHVKHPCVKWTSESYENFDWLMIHFAALLDEYRIRYGKFHACEDIHNWACEHDEYSTHKLGGSERTPFALCMPDIYKTDCPVESYRNYYKFEKAHFAKWERGRPAPDWYKPEGV